MHFLKLLLKYSDLKKWGHWISLITAFLDLFLSTRHFQDFTRGRRRSVCKAQKSKTFSSQFTAEQWYVTFFRQKKKVFESVATFDVSLLCPSKLSLLHNLQDKPEKGNLDAHRWRIEGEVRFFMYSFVLQQVEYYTKMSSFFQSAFSFLPVRHVRGHMAWNAFFSFKVVNPS